MAVRIYVCVLCIYACFDGIYFTFHYLCIFITLLYIYIYIYTHIYM